MPAVPDQPWARAGLLTAVITASRKLDCSVGMGSLIDGTGHQRACGLLEGKYSDRVPAFRTARVCWPGLRRTCALMPLLLRYPPIKRLTGDNFVDQPKTGAVSSRSLKHRASFIDSENPIVESAGKKVTPRGTYWRLGTQRCSPHPHTALLFNFHKNRGRTSTDQSFPAGKRAHPVCTKDVVRGFLYGAASGSSVGGKELGSSSRLVT